jgi:hypothetical protein
MNGDRYDHVHINLGNSRMLNQARQPLSVLYPELYLYDSGLLYIHK